MFSIDPVTIALVLARFSCPNVRPLNKIVKTINAFFIVFIFRLINNAKLRDDLVL